MHESDDHNPSGCLASRSWDDSYSGEISDYSDPDPDLLQIVDSLPPGRALDLGCGAGGLVVALAQRGWQVTGIDIAKKAIAAARKAVEKHRVQAELLVADATTWKPAGEYDLITGSFALPDKAERASIYEMVRDTLPPGGVVLLKDFDPSMHEIGGNDLPTVEELIAAFEGFEIIRAEIVDTPVHDHAGESHSGEHWTAALFHARKPTSEAVDG